MANELMENIVQAEGDQKKILGTLENQFDNITKDDNANNEKCRIETKSAQ